MIIGPSVPSSSPKGGTKFLVIGDGALNLPLSRAKISFGDFVRSAFDELGVGRFSCGSFNMPTFSFEPLHEIFRGFPFSLLDVVDLYRILDALLLLKLCIRSVVNEVVKVAEEVLKCEEVVKFVKSSSSSMLDFCFLDLDSQCPPSLSSLLRAAPFFVDENLGSGFLSDADLSRRILEKTLVGSGLLDMLRERLGFSLLLRSPFLFGVLDSEYCDVCSFSLPTVFRTADVGGVRLSSVGPLMHETLHQPKPSPLEDDELVEEEAIEAITKTSHLEAVKRIFRYIKGTMHLGLWYPKGSGIETIVYADSDHARDYVDRKSTSGVCTFMGCCLTSWFSKKQTALAISTTEAEYVMYPERPMSTSTMDTQALIHYGLSAENHSQFVIIPRPKRK
ncbi:hypothetical protein Tco_0145412 [Tanacetum coccineum]